MSEIAILRFAFVQGGEILVLALLSFFKIFFVGGGKKVSSRNFRADAGRKNCFKNVLFAKF
jgi:hypothetical protein